MVEADKTEVAASGFAPHIEELHEFFRSRDVAFGKPEDLAPFVERLSKDDSFRDEMSSMVRAIIYRERDGLMPAELVELVVTAVAGTTASEAPEQVRDTVRQMLGFIGGVLRSRWSQGAGDVKAESIPPPKPEDAAEIRPDDAETKPEDAAKVKRDDAAGMSAAAETARPVTSMFYQAQVVANGGAEPEDVLPVRETRESKAQRGVEEKPAAKEVAAPPVAAFLRGDSPLRSDSPSRIDTRLRSDSFLRSESPILPSFTVEPRRSHGWVWVVLAMVLSFGAGMFARQRMLGRYGTAWPWHLPAALTGNRGATAPAAVNPSTAPALEGGAANAGAATTQAANGSSAQDAAAVNPGAARSSGAATSSGAAADAGGGAGLSDGPATEADANAAKADRGANAGVSAKDAGAGQMAAFAGASPGLMESHLLFAPRPEYPRQARRARVQGSVEVEALVDRDGSVVEAQAISGPRSLHVAAEEEVYGRRYRPYVVNDIPMAVRTLVTVDFRLR